MRCCFDTTEYTGIPDAEPCPQALNVPEIISGLDRLYNAGLESEAAQYLAGWLERAREAGDWRAELSIVSEQLGQCRRNNDVQLAQRSIDAALALVREHRLGQTVSGATVLLNAATTMKAFGRADESLPVFKHVCRVYAANLDPADYRFAGLFNNMALSYADVGDTQEAENCFLRALRIVEKTREPGNDIAVTYCNMAEMFGARDAEDTRIEKYLDLAWEALNAPGLPHDGYHAFTISKCLPCFDKYGFFLYAKALRAREAEIRSRG